MNQYIKLDFWYQIIQNLNKLINKAVRSNNAKVK